MVWQRLTNQPTPGCSSNRIAEKRRDTGGTSSFHSETDLQLTFPTVHCPQHRCPIIHPEQPIRPSCKLDGQDGIPIRDQPVSNCPMAVLPRQGQGCPARLLCGQPISQSLYSTSTEGCFGTGLHPGCKHLSLAMVTCEPEWLTVRSTNYTLWSSY